MRGFRNGFDVLRNRNAVGEIVWMFMTEGNKSSCYDRSSEGFVGKMQESKEPTEKSLIFKATKKTTDCIKGL